MSYIEDRLTIFDKQAKRIFQEQRQSLQEKETYLNGTKFLRLRVLNNLVESTKIQMKNEMQSLLIDCRKNAPEFYPSLESSLAKALEQYIQTFRQDILI